MSNLAVAGNDDLSDVLRAIAKKLDDNKREMDDNKNEIDIVRQDSKREIESIKSDVRSLSDDVAGVKESQFLEPWQANEVTEAAKRRAFEVLEIKWVDGQCAPESMRDYKKYYGKFVRLIHNDAKKIGLETGKVIYTPRRNYKLLLEFIGDWYPTRGVAGQKKYYDDLEAAGKK